MDDARRPEGTRSESQQAGKPAPRAEDDDMAPSADGPPPIPESIGTPGLTGVVQEGGRPVRAGSRADAGALDSKERRGSVGEATPSPVGSGDAVTQVGAAGEAPVREATEVVAPTSDEQTLRLHEEELRVSKERVQAGEVQVHKRVVTELQTMQVPVEREELVIERAGEVTVVDAGGNAQTAPAPAPPSWQQRVRQRPAALIGSVIALLALVLMLVLWRTGRIGGRGR
jgi:hypothetical protein